MIENDIKAHQPSFDSMNDEAHKVMASGGVAEAQGLRHKLNQLNNSFDEVAEKTTAKKAELEGALQEVSRSRRTGTGFGFKLVCDPY